MSENKEKSYVRKFYSWQIEAEKAKLEGDSLSLFWADKVSEIARLIQDRGAENISFNMPLLFMTNEMYLAVRKKENDQE